MDERIGFFTRESIRNTKGNKKTGSKKANVVATAKGLGLRGVRDLNSSAKHPCMDPSGDKDADVYVLGEAPGKQEDDEGVPFVGKSGRLLRSGLPRHGVRYNNCCRTRPPKNRNPTAFEVECFRESIERDIARTKPKAIIGTGKVPFEWMFPSESSTEIRVARGRRFPVEIRGHRTWFYPVMHPAFILRIEGSRSNDIPGDEWKEAFLNDLRRPFEDRPGRPQIEPTDDKSLSKGIETYDGKNEWSIVRALDRLGKKHKTFALDIETTALRPYGKDASFLSMAIGTYDRTVAFPFHHTNTRLVYHIRKFLRERARRIVCHNTLFELEWLMYFLGDDIAGMCDWEDTQSQAYVLDERAGALSLNFRCLEVLGFPLKQYAEVDRGSLRYAPLDKLLRYNGMDVRYTYKLWKKQRTMLEGRGLSGIYDLHIERIPVLAKAQNKGIPIQLERAKRIRDKYKTKEDEAASSLRRFRTIRRFEQRFGPFNPASSQDVIRLFRDVLHREEGWNEDRSKYSCTDATLEEIGKRNKTARRIRDYRRYAKLRGTYLDRFLPDHPSSFVWPDGFVHCSYKHTLTATGRLSSENPNNQNWPKRRDKQIRSIVQAPKGWTILSFDYGQIEARVIAMASRDPKFVDALWDRLDVHMEWAEKIAKRCPLTLRAADNDMKALRSRTKNQFVFPLFFGAGTKKVSRLLHIDEDDAQELIDDFWSYFASIRKWQKKQLELYQKRGYVESLTGRRRHAPLSYNMVVNTGIQGTASDITVDAMVRIFNYALSHRAEWMFPVLNIHDDITFIVPEEKVTEAVERIVPLMLRPPFSWINVPIQVEVEAGRRWDKQEEVGEYSSDRM